VFALTSARGLLRGLRRLHERAPGVARALRVRFLGRIVETEADAFEGTEALGVERVGYVPHAQVLHELAGSHLALCLLDDVPGAERIYPAKIFELMRVGRPVLTLAPPGSALARLVARHALGRVVHPRDEVAIADALHAMLQDSDRSRAGPLSWRNAPRPDILRYDRRALAGEVAEILREAAASSLRRAS
jgi:glycosyltransferase involved in cell wall biosynthesis